MANFSERIVELLDRHGLSYQEFANRVNDFESDGARLSKSFVADVISNKREPRYKTVVRIARTFNISTDYLLGVTDTDATLHEDENVTIKTTGLSSKCVMQLSELKKHAVFHEYAELLELMIDEVYQTYLRRNRIKESHDEEVELFEVDYLPPHFFDDWNYAEGTVLDFMRELFAFDLSFINTSGFLDSFSLAKNWAKDGTHEKSNLVKNPDGSVFTIHADIIEEYLVKQFAEAVCGHISEWKTKRWERMADDGKRKKKGK